MALLELVRTRPDWYSALEAALTRPEGVPERRANDDPWTPQFDRPRRVSDDLAWLRCAVDEPETHGLTQIDEQLPIWESAGDDRQIQARLERLEGRGILQAGGFLLHEPTQREQSGSSALSGSTE